MECDVTASRNDDLIHVASPGECGGHGNNTTATTAVISVFDRYTFTELLAVHDATALQVMIIRVSCDEDREPASMCLLCVIFKRNAKAFSPNAVVDVRRRRHEKIF